MSGIQHFRELSVNQNAMNLSLEIYQLTKGLPVGEKCSLMDQVRRSSRSVCAKISRAWRKMRYAPAFVAKLNDAEAEAVETQVWLKMAHKIGLMDEASFLRLDDKYNHVIRQLVRMINEPRKWCITKERDRS